MFTALSNASFITVLTVILELINVNSNYSLLFESFIQLLRTN